MLTALAHRVVLASGWGRRAIAFAAGACGALAMAPVNAVPAMIVPMTVAVWLVDGAGGVAGERGRPWPSLRSAAGAGWWWGFGYFVAGLWWMGAAFLVEPDKFAWALPFGVLGLPAVAALYPALGFAIARLVWLRGGGRVLSLAFGLGIAEALRATLLTGFPWNEFGMALGGNLVLAQLASLVGLHGLTLVTVALFATPATLADDGRPGLARRFGPVTVAALALAGLTAFGLVRLSAGDPGSVAGVKLRIMQPNITQDAEFTYDNRDAVLRRYLALSDRATSAGTSGLADVTHLIWPESAFPFILSREPDALNAIAAALPPKTVLVTGAARMEGRPGSPTSPAKYFNAIQVVGSGGVVLDSYDKVHLVPFGEYLPLDDLLGRLGVHHFVHVPGGFEPGTRHHLLAVPGLPPVAPAVCYEAIFPGETLPDEAEARRAGLLLNVTNDSWFGRTAGPHQHLAQARLRTIETGLPMVRAAATGISAIIDPYGRILARSALGTEDVVDGPLPSRIAPTPFALHGRWAMPGMLALLGLSLLVLSRAGGRRAPP